MHFVLVICPAIITTLEGGSWSQWNFLCQKFSQRAETLKAGCKCILLLLKLLKEMGLKEPAWTDAHLFLGAKVKPHR